MESNLFTFENHEVFDMVYHNRPEDEGEKQKQIFSNTEPTKFDLLKQRTFEEDHDQMHKKQAQSKENV